MTNSVIIYYDDEPNIGVNATCVDWPCRNEYFRNFSEFEFFVYVEYGDRAELIEITAENYPVLCQQGVFNV